MNEAFEPTAAPPSRRRRRVLRGLGVVVAIYLVVAYVILPAWWRRYETRHPALADIASTVTHTGNGIPGDPLNIALVGSERDIHLGMIAAGWFPADPITLASSIRIAGDVILHRKYDDAPVSNLYLFGRKEDLAFELPIGDDPDKRHHVRFWRSEKVDASGRPLWWGAATMDARVGLSGTTEQITHHIAPNVDAERDLILANLKTASVLAKVQWIDGFHKVLEGKNGGGDPWRTDGRLGIGILTAGKSAATRASSTPGN